MNQMPFTYYREVDVPQTNSNGATLFTTSAVCEIFFLPRGSNMESDAPVGIYVENYYIDTDGDPVSPYLFYAYDRKVSVTVGGTFDEVSGIGFNNNSDNGPDTYLNIPMVVPAGKDLKAYIGNSSDRLGGTLYIKELP